MKKTLFTLAAFASLAFAQTQTYTYSYGGLSIPIYPDEWDTVAVATILVPRSISITKVTATVQVQFNGVGDLKVYLWSPEGTRRKLVEHNCGALVNIDTTFDDSPTTRFSDFCPSEAGRGPYRPNELLEEYIEENGYGYWRLGVENDESEKTGYLTGFSVTISGTPSGPPLTSKETIVSAGSFKGGSVAPGEQLAIFGVSLGPAGGVRAPAGANLPTSLGSTSVTFDGVAAPLFFAGDRLVVVHAPTTLSPGATTNIQVVTQSASTAVIPMPVHAAKPAVFTVESGGAGQAKAINQDGSVNGDGSVDPAHQGAPVGSVIAMYATGLGTVNPPIAQGVVAPSSPLSRVTLPVTATIGGRAATVTYAGAAPGLVGTYQVNITVPPLTPRGANSLVLNAGGNTSQDGVIIQIR